MRQVWRFVWLLGAVLLGLAIGGFVAMIGLIVANLAEVSR